MKKIAYAFAILLGLGIIAYNFWQYRRTQYYSLSPVNEKFIKEKAFGKDSNGKGYSDQAEILMNEDLAFFNVVVQSSVFLREYT